MNNMTDTFTDNKDNGQILKSWYGAPDSSRWNVLMTISVLDSLDVRHVRFCSDLLFMGLSAERSVPLLSVAV